MADLKVPEVNVVILSGRLTSDPDYRTTPGGVTVGRMSIAVNRRVKNKQGEWDDEVSFLDGVIWGEYAERWQGRLRKGLPVIIEGSLRSRRWETKDGQKKTSVEIFINRIQSLEWLERPSVSGSKSPSRQDDNVAGKAEEEIGGEDIASSSPEEVPF